MGIKSNSFGGVTLTKKDAKKFKQQITYGKPKAAAAESIKRGVQLARDFHKGRGSVSFTIKCGKRSG